MHQGLQSGLADTIKEPSTILSAAFRSAGPKWNGRRFTRISKRFSGVECLSWDEIHHGGHRRHRFVDRDFLVGLPGDARRDRALVVAPLSASVVQMLVEFFGKQYVDFHREQTRERQQALVSQQLQPLATG